ncbi:MAG: hypothetical protein OES20_02425 [Gammaproteobacteria bacterium]|nr:hypothetical protein [Gammaproteobacteria bacterium]MDH3858307.1 hypothetical protein [Gammaproteobacteria bacterium]
MKFSELVEKAEKLVGKYEKGRRIKPRKLDKLQQLLSDKKSRYQAKLAETDDPGKRQKLETRLRVVTAQLEKSKHLRKVD